MSAQNGMKCWPTIPVLVKPHIKNVVAKSQKAGWFIPVKRAFNYKRPVFIGNKAEYAVYALEGGKTQLFIQGSLGKMIKETMSDKGRLFVGGSTTGGFGSSQGGVKYTEFSKWL